MGTILDQGADQRAQNNLDADRPDAPYSPYAPTLTVSIVVYHSDDSWLQKTLHSLEAALLLAQATGTLGKAHVMLVDNGATGATSHWANILRAQFCDDPANIESTLLAGHGNVGYGRANNLALRQTARTDYVLALNPDVELAVDSIAAGITFLQRDRACGMVTPVATAPDGAPSFLVKQYPSVWVLAVRGFAPAFFRRWCQRRLDLYERADRPFDSPLTDAKFVSGCFMLMRTSAFERAKGFDESFFLYFEDFDLSYRISQFAAVVRLPECRIVHAGGGASRKGRTHVTLFVKSALHFFRKHGWRW